MSVLTFALIVAGAVAAGLFVGYFVAITINWLRKKITVKLAEKNVKHVIVADIENLVKNSSNRITLSDLNSITGGRRAEVIAAVDEKNKIVGDIEIAKDTNVDLDAEVDEILGEERKIVVDI